jgi:hypothetical protein
LTRAFQIRPELLVLSFCQFSRNSFSPLGIEETHILAIDLLALLCRRIRARNVEIPVLHEVVIGIAAARFSPACKPCAAICHQSTALVIRRGFGLYLSTHSSKSRTTSGGAPENGSAIMVSRTSAASPSAPLRKSTGLVATITRTAPVGPITRQLSTHAAPPSKSLRPRRGRPGPSRH